MSASLVGSEMCIRDRGRPHPGLTQVGDPPAVRGKVARAVAGRVTLLDRVHRHQPLGHHRVRGPGVDGELNLRVARVLGLQGPVAALLQRQELKLRPRINEEGTTGTPLLAQGRVAV
eukprot:124690-Alexandrium_andersonii.AAC.1